MKILLTSIPKEYTIDPGFYRIGSLRGCKRAGWCGLLLLCITSAVQAQQYALVKLPLFPDRSDILIKDVTRDSLGFIWFLTNSEVYRYDGYRSLNILPTISDRHAFEDTPQKILADKQNRLWMAGNLSLSYLDLKTWKIHYIDPAFLPDGKDRTVLWIKQMPDGTIITAYQNGCLVLFRDGKASLISTLYQLSLQQNNPIVPEACTFWRGQYRIGTSAGTLFSIHPGNPAKTQYQHLPGIHQAIFHLVALEDRLVIDVFKQGLFALNQEMQLSEQTLEGTKAEVEGGRVFQESSQRYLYAGAQNIFVLDKKLRVIQKLDVALRHRYIVITEEEIVLGTEEGIYVLYNKPDGLGELLPCNGDQNKSVRGLYAFPDGGIFWTSYGGAGYVEVSGTCHVIKSLKTAFAALPLNNAELLVGTEGGFLKIFNRQTLTVREFPYSLTEEAKKKFSHNLPTAVLSLAQTEKDYLIGSTKGLWMADKAKHSLHPLEILLDGQPIQGLQIRHILPFQGEWLLSTQLGLLQVRADGKGKIWYPTEGSTGVYKAVLAKDTLWLATQGKGLVALSRTGKLLKSWTKSDGLSDNLIYSLEVINGMKVAGTADGLNLLHNGLIRRLSEKEGLNHSEFNSGASFWDAPRQQLYVGGLKGYTVLDLKKSWMRAHRTESYISEVHVASAEHIAIEKDYAWPYSSKNRLDLKPGQSLMGLYLGTPGNYRSDVSVKYMLKEGAWQTLAPGQFISLIEPSPGTYPIQLETISTGAQGTRKSLVITRLPAYYETWWFKALIFFGAIFVVISWYRSKIRKVHREQELRNRIAADLHDEVGGLLTGISMQAELLRMTNEPQRHLRYFDQLSALSKEAIRSMGDVVWALDSRFDTWESLIGKLRNYSVQLFDASPARFSMEVKGTPPDTLLQKERQTVYLLIREALNNSCKHAGATIVSLKIVFSARRIAVIITDDGTGFEPDSKYTGNGLKNMRKRAATIGGHFDIRSSASGTIVELIFSPDTSLL